MVETENAMKQRKWFLLIIILVISSLSVEACSFSVKTLSTPTSPEILSTPTATQAFIPSIATETAVAPTDILPAVTPTLISIRADTIPMLEVVSSFNLREIVHSITFTRDGTVLAAAGGNTEDYAIRLWDVVNAQSLGELDGHAGIVWDVAFSPDGQSLAVGGVDEPQGQIRNAAI